MSEGLLRVTGRDPHGARPPRGRRRGAERERIWCWAWSARCWWCTTARRGASRRATATTSPRSRWCPATRAAPARLVSGSADGTVRWWYPDGTLEGDALGLRARRAGARRHARRPAAGGQHASASSRPGGCPRAPGPPTPSACPRRTRGGPGGGLVTRLPRRPPPPGRARHGRGARARGAAHAARCAAWPGSTCRRPPTRCASSRRATTARCWRSAGTARWSSWTPSPARACSRWPPRADGAHAAWAADDGTRVLWSLDFNKEIARAKDTLVRSLAFSDDGTDAGGGPRRQARGAARRGRPARSSACSIPSTAPSPRSLSPPTARFARGRLGDGRVTLWDVGRRDGAAHAGTSRARASARSTSTPSGKLLAAGSDDGSAWVFSAPDGALLGQVPADSGDVLLVAFTEKSLLVVGSDRVAHHLHP